MDFALTQYSVEDNPVLKISSALHVLTKGNFDLNFKSDCVNLSKTSLDLHCFVSGIEVF